MICLIKTGTDHDLLAFLRTFLEESNLPTVVKTGKLAFWYPHISWRVESFLFPSLFYDSTNNRGLRRGWHHFLQANLKLCNQIHSKKRLSDHEDEEFCTQRTAWSVERGILRNSGGKHESFYDFSNRNNVSILHALNHLMRSTHVIALIFLGISDFWLYGRVRERDFCPRQVWRWIILDRRRADFSQEWK